MHFHLHGYGYVGRAVVNKFARRDTFTIFDPLYPELKTDIDQKHDGVIVCVPTPEGEAGSCDFTQVSKVVKQYDKNTPILIKSTISQETADHIKDWNITFNPEFLRAETADADYEKQTHIYLGGGDLEFWEMVFFRHFAKAYISKSDIKTLILTKYFKNAFLATKVAFFNQIYDVCNKHGVKFEDVRKFVTEDARIGDSHSWVTEERGFGGACFPKDTRALVFENPEVTLVQTAIDYNNTIRNK
jgi:UDPglucose 6-dehydrogenase